MSCKILVATYTSSIYTLNFTPSTSSLSIISSTEIGFQPSWIDFVSSKDRRVIGCMEKEDGEVFLSEVDEDTGKLTVLARAQSGGHSPCHVLAVCYKDETQIIAANVRTPPPFCRTKICTNADTKQINSTYQEQSPPILSSLPPHTSHPHPHPESFRSPVHLGRIKIGKTSHTLTRSFCLQTTNQNY